MLKRIPNTYIILSILILFSAVLTWFIPGGEYSKSSDGTFHYMAVEKAPQTFQVFTALQKGFAKQASIIVFVLIVGGVFWIINHSKAIDMGIFTLLHKLNKFEKKSKVSPSIVSSTILVLIMLVFSSFGAIFGMSEETIAFVAIIIPLVISLGYDSITGVSVVFVAAGLGFAGAILNPFTIGIAQKIADIPMFSGIEYRLFCWIIINAIGITYILIYAHKVYKTPSRSLMHKDDKFWRNRSYEQKTLHRLHTKSSWYIFGILQITSIIVAFQYPITSFDIGNATKSVGIMPVLAGLFCILSIITLRKSVHFFILNLLFFTIIYLLVGVMGYGWYMDEISAIFMVLGISAALSMGYNGNKVVKLFVEGAKDILSAAIIIGLAAGIIVILEDGKTIAPLLHAASQSMEGLNKSTTIGLMYILQTLLNIFIPSGSAQAAITIPIMAPLSELLSIPKQAAIVAFQFGDGFTNMITPTSGVLMGVLGMAKIPFATWIRWFFPFLILLVLVGYVLLLPTVYMDLNGF